MSISIDTKFPANDGLCGGEGGQLKCPVCFDPIQMNALADVTAFKKKLARPVAVLACGHCFHLDCIGNSFNAKKAMECPCCRATQKGEWNAPKTPREARNGQEPGDSPNDLFVSIQRAVLFRELLSLRRTGIEDMERLSLVARRLIPNGRSDQSNTPGTGERRQTVVRVRRRTVALRPRAATDDGNNAERIPLTPRRRRPRRGRSLSIDASSTDSSNRRRTSRRRFERRQPESISPRASVPAAAVSPTRPQSAAAPPATRPSPLAIDSEPVYSTVDLPSTPVIKRVVSLAKAEMRLLQVEILQREQELAVATSVAPTENDTNSTADRPTTFPTNVADISQKIRADILKRRECLSQALGTFRCSAIMMENGRVSREEADATHKFLRRHIASAQKELRGLHQSEASREAALLRRIGVLREMEKYLEKVPISNMLVSPTATVENRSTENMYSNVGALTERQPSAC